MTDASYMGFVGVTTSNSSIMKIFPAWAEALESPEMGRQPASPQTVGQLACIAAFTVLGAITLVGCCFWWFACSQRFCLGLYTSSSLCRRLRIFDFP